MAQVGLNVCDAQSIFCVVLQETILTRKTSSYERGWVGWMGDQKEDTVHVCLTTDAIFPSP